MHKYLSRFLAVLTAATFLYIVGGFVYLFVPLGPWISPWCTHDLLAEAASPNGDRSAKAFYFICDPWGSQQWTTVVLVRNGSWPSEDNEVLMVDTHNGEIQLNWKTSEELEILVTTTSYISHQKSEFAGVKIDVVPWL